MAEEALTRAYMIKNFGPGEARSVRDAQELCARSVDTIVRDPEEIARMAENWRRLPLPDIHFLRRMKNIMTTAGVVLEQLDEDSPLRDEITTWLALIPKLP